MVADPGGELPGSGFGRQENKSPVPDPTLDSGFGASLIDLTCSFRVSQYNRYVIGRIQVGIDPDSAVKKKKTRIRIRPPKNIPDSDPT